MTKVAVIGGGSSYTPELVQGFLDRRLVFPLTDLWLVDISQERLDVVGGFARRMVAAQESPFRLHLTTDWRAGIAGAAYVVTQLRIGGQEARRQDEYLGARHGLIGQETTGVGGMAMALRTIPVILDIAREMLELAPHALLVNFTNPAGLITEAVQRYVPDVAAVGVCNVAITAKIQLLDLWQRRTGEQVAPHRAHLDTLGLNHLSWHRGLSIDGQDVWSEILDALLEHLARDAHPQWDTRLIEVLGMVPNYYLEYYYYTDRMLALQARWPPSRAEQVMEVERDLLAYYSDTSRSSPPDGLMKRGGAWYSTLATQLLNAHFNDLNEIQTVNLPHAGAIEGWPDDWVLEMPARVGRNGIHPISSQPLPPVCCGLLAHVKAYEILVVEAAVHGDIDSAYQALLAHPLGPKAAAVQAVLDDMLETNRPYLGTFRHFRRNWAGAKAAGIG